MFLASLFLAAGSFSFLTLSVLFVALATGYRNPGLAAAACGFLLLGALFHLMGWFGLALAARDTWRTHRRIGVAFILSLFAFGFGLATLPFAFPGTGWAAILGFWFFPLIPSVYAPVVLVHAILFRLPARETWDRKVANLLTAGSVFLVVSAVAGIGMQLAARSLGAIVYTAPGLTGIGYALIAVGLRRGRRPANTPPGGSPALS